MAVLPHGKKIHFEKEMIPKEVKNWINGKEIQSKSGEIFEKISPHSGETICKVTRSTKIDIDNAVAEAKQAQIGWENLPAVQRGHLLHQICNALESQTEKIASIVALETGKSQQEALGETGGAIALGRFYAGEGQRLYGRTTTSGVENKYASTVRQPCGVAGLIIAANTPIANVAWKVFPALICGNGVVLKAAEDTPATAWIFAKIAHEAGLPKGVLNVIQGLGVEAGAPLVENNDVDVISFTGSTCVGRWIAETAGKRLAKVSLELGGKNPLIVCDDADIDNAVKWVCLSAFSNAGQRCASGSRIIIFSSIYDEFKKKLLIATKKLSIGPTDSDDLGPVINEKQLSNMLTALEEAKLAGSTILFGGKRIETENHKNGFYITPTLLENVKPEDDISQSELFGPIAILYRVGNFQEAIALANNSPYGLTASIHTKNYHRAMEFSHKVKCGSTVVNAGTYGSEPHMPFGGLRQSGNGSREPGTEALDIYSELKDIYMVVDPKQL
jgi:alpha-ketoglutaric semialdehyde dehydrogenase